VHQPQRTHVLLPASYDVLPWAHFQALVDQLIDGVTVQDVTGKLVYANARGAELSGYASPDALLAAPVGDYLRTFQVMDASGAPIGLDELPGRQALRSGHGHRILRVRKRATGDERWTDVHSFVMRDATGTIEFVVNVIRDVTSSIATLQAAETHGKLEAEARGRAEFLSRVAAVLGESLDYEQTLNKVASLLIPRLADWCAVDLVDAKTGALRRVAVAHGDPEKVKWGWELYRRFPPNMSAPSGVANVLRTGQPELYASISDEMLVRAARNAEELQLLRALGLHSALLVPLRIADRTGGVISLVATESRKRFSDDDIAVAGEVAQRAGAAIERAELYAIVTEHARWLARLQQLTVALSRSVTLVDAIDTATNLARQLFGADASGLWLLSKDRNCLELGGSFGASEESRRIAQTLPIGADYPTSAVFVRGEPILLESPEAISEQFPAMRDIVGTQGMGAIANGPVKVGGETIGVLGFRYNTPRQFSDDYVTALRTFSKELGQAIDRTRIHAELEAAKKAAEDAKRTAEAANGAKSAFLATMSHELRTPINAVLGFTDLLELGITGGDQGAPAEYVSRIRRNTKHLLELIDDILDWSRVEAGQLVIDATPSVASDVIQGAVDVVKQQADTRGIELTSECPDGATYIGDPLRVRQVLLNLLSNAIKFTPRGGRVALSCGMKGSETVFEVSDTGIGIEEADFERIFDPFVQTANVYTRQSGGTGLGLSISRRLAELMGGRLTVESTVGQGATFILTLRAAERGHRPR
jgi:signal transduction histidine kinase